MDVESEGFSDESKEGLDVFLIKETEAAVMVSECWESFVLAAAFEEFPDFSDLFVLESDASFAGLFVVWFHFIRERIFNMSHCKKSINKLTTHMAVTTKSQGVSGRYSNHLRTSLG